MGSLTGFTEVRLYTIKIIISNKQTKCFRIEQVLKAGSFNKYDMVSQPRELFITQSIFRQKSTTERLHNKQCTRVFIFLRQRRADSQSIELTRGPP